MTKTSRGARDLAGNLLTTKLGQYEPMPSVEEAAAVIDAELAELLLFIAHTSGCASLIYCSEHGCIEPTGKACDCGLSALLDRWSVK